jgi:diguanylate cyclase (GGDEF)-like protein
MTTYFIAIALSGLYQNAALPLYCAALISIEYILLYILAMLSGQAVLFRMETFRDNIMSWDILVVNVIAFMGTGLLMNLITRRHMKLSLQLQESSEKLLREEEESRHNQEKVRFFENYDLLTRLPNIDHFRQRLEREILKAESRKQVFAVMCLGLDSFKKVNQLHGMETGHLVLREVGLRLKDSFREDDSICRFMGDKFLVLLSDLSASEDMGDLIRKTRLALSSPFPAKAGDIAVTASGGLCAYPHDALTASALIENAEAAMYLAKNDGKGVFRLWDKRMHEELDLRVRMEIELEQALKRNELYLAF